MLREEERAAERQRTGERLALDELEHQGFDTARIFKTVDAGNVGVIQGGEDFRFTLEPGKTLSVCREELGQNFERDVALQSRVSGPIDLSHPAGPQSGKDFVRAEAGAGGDGQLLSWIIPADRRAPTGVLLR